MEHTTSWEDWTRENCKMSEESDIAAWHEGAEAAKNYFECLASKGEMSDGMHTFNELYDYRMAYNAMLVNQFAEQGLYNCHKSKRHSDGEECFGGGWFIVNMELPTGQVSNHYPLEHWDKFKCEERDIADPWDGHTPQVAYHRMIDFIML